MSSRYCIDAILQENSELLCTVLTRSFYIARFTYLLCPGTSDAV